MKILILYQEFYSLKLRNIFVFPVFFSYSCVNSTCPVSNYQPDEDYGYWTVLTCKQCEDRCSNDTNCGGVRCGGPDDSLQNTTCRWWKQGKCETKDEQTVEDPGYTTCTKFRAGE